MVDTFSYLGSVITSSGQMTVEVDKKVVQASRAFGALRKSVFIDKHLKISTKKKFTMRVLCCVVLWNRLLGPSQKAGGEAEHLSPSMH